MNKDHKIVEQLIDYVNQLRRHTEGRRAIHIKLSALERHFREEHYRLFCASTLRILVTKFGATIFSLPNADIVVITREAAVDNIDPPLAVIRRKLRESAIVSSLDPVQGVSDAFIEWFDLETQYAEFRTHIQALGARLSGAEVPLPTAPATPKTVGEEAPKPSKTPKGGLGAEAEELLALIQKQMQDENRPYAPPPSRKVRLIPIAPPVQEVDDLELDPEMLLSLYKALHGADVAGMLRRQRVMAILGNEPPMEVFIHRQVPQRVLFETLFKSRVVARNRWLTGYLEDYVAKRVLYSVPGMDTEKSLASSLRVTSQSVLSEAFDAFDLTLGGKSRSKVILEFSAIDIVASPRDYVSAARLASERGYRLAVADIDPASLLWLDHDHLQADFIKIRKPNLPASVWLDSNAEAKLADKVGQIGMARAVMDGCDKAEDIALGQRLGFTLFQGEAVDPMAAIF